MSKKLFQRREGRPCPRPVGGSHPSLASPTNRAAAPPDPVTDLGGAVYVGRPHSFVGSLSNVPSEVAHLLAEIDHKDKKVTELAQRIARREGEVQKHHKTAGLHTENPKEAESVQKCRADFEKMETLSAEKVALAERLMNTLQRLLPKIQIELARLHGEPVPNIAARFGMVLPPEQLAQPAFSPSPLPSSALVDSTNKRAPTPLQSDAVSSAIGASANMDCCRPQARAGVHQHIPGPLTCHPFKSLPGLTRPSTTTLSRVLSSVQSKTQNSSAGGRRRGCRRRRGRLRL